MFATLRAAVSLCALIGFYVLALGLVAGIAYGGFLLARSGVRLGAWLALAAAIGAIIVVVQLLVAAFSRPQPKPGRDVTPEDAPELWALVTNLSDAIGTRGPGQIRLVAEANASVTEDSRFMGLIPGPRRMYLGVPLLQGLTVTQLRAVLAHEFGHYSSAHTRLGPIAYRGQQAVVETVRGLHSADMGWVSLVLRPYVWVLRFYMGLYVVMSLAMSRSQEREADRLMVLAGGRANAQAALREIHVISVFWSAYLDQFVGLGWGSDLAPTADGFVGGFERLLAARPDERDSIRAEVEASKPVDPAEKSISDYKRELLYTHPPIAERIYAMETLPDRTDPPPDDDRRASALIPEFVTAAAATAEEAFVFGYRDRVEWDELVRRVWTASDDRMAGNVYQEAARLANQPTATLATVVALSEAGRVAQLVSAVEPDRAVEATEVFEPLVRAAVVQAGAARWRMSWSRGCELMTPDGETFDAKTVATLLADPKSAPDAAARLADLGVDVSAIGPVVATPAADVGQIVGGIADMKSDGATYDVLILDTGLILAEKPHETQVRGWDRLNTLIESGSVAQIAARHWFVPYGSMASAEVSAWRTAGMAFHAKITFHDGSTLRLKETMSGEYLTSGDEERFKGYLRQIR
ncbi:MAG TPA: M48 family metallopeptidase [Mycobacterium sp.]|nr:M48 family metallopeptidase [Mycobacterium sp.]